MYESMSHVRPNDRSAAASFPAEIARLCHHIGHRSVLGTVATVALPGRSYRPRIHEQKNLKV